MMMEESIYNIIPPKLVELQRPVMHRSCFSGKQPPSASTFHTFWNTTFPSVSNIAGDADVKLIKDKSHAQFGKPRGTYRPIPENFTKKFSKSSSVPSLVEIKKTNPSLLVPTDVGLHKSSSCIPKASDRPIMGLVSKKNFLVSNAVEAILAQPKKVCKSAKDYLKKDDYGKAPKYLELIKKDIDAEYDYIRKMQTQHEQSLATHTRLDEQERHQIINGLKAKWEQVNTDYQGLTYITVVDAAKKFRKEKWEAELANLEKDLGKLSKENILIDHSS